MGPYAKQGEVAIAAGASVALLHAARISVADQ